jgi:hypothetical protein
MDGSINDGLLVGGGTDLLGSELSLEDALVAARQHYKWMPLCAVKEWVILDAIVNEAEGDKVAALGCLPVFLFAQRVVHDEQRRFEAGHWVRSGMATSFKEGFMFATRNTVYLLLGGGRRKPSSIDVIFSIC